MSGPWAGKRGAEHPCFKHGHASSVDAPPSREYAIWAAMMRRCYTPTNTMYARYGGRGIRVCERWHRFENFFADMGAKPVGKSLDRKNNDGDYELDNCRWGTKIEQARNTSTTRWATINGERRPLAEWCERYNINRSTVLRRINRGGWPVERAITTPAVSR